MKTTKEIQTKANEILLTISDPKQMLGNYIIDNEFSAAHQQNQLS